MQQMMALKENHLENLHAANAALTNSNKRLSNLSLTKPTELSRTLLIWFKIYAAVQPPSPALNVLSQEVIAGPMDSSSTKTTTVKLALQSVQPQIESYQTRSQSYRGGTTGRRPPDVYICGGFDLPKLPAEARLVKIIPGLNKSLVSVSHIIDHGCKKVTLDATKVTATINNRPSTTDKSSSDNEVLMGYGKPQNQQHPSRNNQQTQFRIASPSVTFSASCMQHSSSW